MKRKKQTILREIKKVSQQPGGHFRRWFTCSKMELYVWYETSGEIYGFQLCYRQDLQEKALTWTKDKGFSHRGIDDGDNPMEGQFKKTPILVPDGHFSREEVSAMFREASGSVDEEVARFVSSKLDEYPDAGENSDS